MPKESKIIHNNKHCLKFRSILAIFSKKIIWVYGFTFKGVWCVREILKSSMKSAKIVLVCVSMCRHHCRQVDSSATTYRGEWAGGSDALSSSFHLWTGSEAKGPLSEEICLIEDFVFLFFFSSHLFLFPSLLLFHLIFSSMMDYYRSIIKVVWLCNGHHKLLV